MMPRFFPIFILTVLFGISVPAQTNEPRKLEIDDFVSRAGKTFETAKKVFTVTEIRKTKRFAVEESNFRIQKGERLTRKYSYTMNGRGIEILAVHYKTEKVSAEEFYYFRNKRLVYASEQHFITSNGATVDVWSGHFYFANGALIDYGTNGHGKSEDDKWDPESDVLKMSRTRLAQLNKYLGRMWKFEKFGK